MHKGDHFPACAFPRLFIDESYAVREQVLKQAVEVADGKTHLLNTGSALVEKSTDGCVFTGRFKKLNFGNGSDAFVVGRGEKSRGDALVRHGFVFVSSVKAQEGPKRGVVVKPVRRDANVVNVNGPKFHSFTSKSAGCGVRAKFVFHDVDDLTQRCSRPHGIEDGWKQVLLRGCTPTYILQAGGNLLVVSC